MHVSNLPTIEELGRDVIRLPRWRVIISLIAPFGLFCLYMQLAFSGWWMSAILSVIALSFVTYGSVSHDLVHRSLGLPRWLNDLLLTSIELLLFRSGRAYRLVHLNHHARYPDAENDPEAIAAHGTFKSALRSGPFFFVRLWWWAVQHNPSHRQRLLIEAIIIVNCVEASVISACVGWTIVPVVYLLLVYVGTWIVPLITAYIPHNPKGGSTLSQTRRFRGWMVRLIAFDHLYHLEHHLYPAVPHHRWAELARRLDPYLDRAGVPSVRLGF
jgi:beta-carotene hydroxylase